jgi:hypothetical protein
MDRIAFSFSNSMGSVHLSIDHICDLAICFLTYTDLRNFLARIANVGSAIAAAREPPLLEGASLKSQIGNLKSKIHCRGGGIGRRARLRIG